MTNPASHWLGNSDTIFLDSKVSDSLVMFSSAKMSSVFLVNIPFHCVFNTTDKFNVTGNEPKLTVQQTPHNILLAPNSTFWL